MCTTNNRSVSMTVFGFFIDHLQWWRGGGGRILSESPVRVVLSTRFLVYIFLSLLQVAVVVGTR